MLYNTIKKNSLSLWLIALLAVSPSVFYAQTANLAFLHLSPEEGLSQASNDYIHHDSKGFVWLSSIDGLNRFDGKSVKVYKSISGDSTSLLGNIITSNFYEDEQTNLWFTSYEGIHCYIREKDHFQHFQLKDDTGATLKENYHAFHLDKKKQLWVRVGIGATGKLFLLNIQDTTYRVLCPIDGQHNYPVLGKKGDVKQVVSCNINGKTGITVLDTQAPFSLRSFFDGNQADQATMEVKHFTNIEDDDTWFLGTDNGLVLFESQTQDYRFFNQYDGNDIGHVSSTVNINDSILWVASVRQGVLVFNKKTEQFIGNTPAGSTDKLGLQLKAVNKLYKDHQENIWISSFSSGVNYTNLGKQKFDVLAEFIGQNIGAIFETSQGEVFCSHGRGFTTYYPTVEKSEELSPILLAGKQSIQFFFEHNDDLWATSPNQLLKWNKKLRQFESIQDLPNYILYVYQLRNGRLLFATYSGIFEFNIIDGAAVFTPFHSFGEYQQALATSIYETQEGLLYLAVDASKVLVLESDRDNYVVSGEIEGIGYAKDYREEEAFLWIATSTGLLKINKKNGANTLLNEAEHGIPNENYYCVIPDVSGSFWLSCNRGVIRYFPETQTHRRYTRMDGLQASEYNTNAFLKTNNGEIWLGGVKGVNRFIPANIKDSPYLPKIQITRLLINDEPFKIEKQIGELTALNLAYTNNTLSFDFVALEYGDPENNQLQYQLENHENDWVDAEKNSFARYSNLPPGDYVFKIKASNSDGIWNETPYSLNIAIKKPWWQTWWFYLISLVTVSGIVYSIAMYRLQQALKIERIRVKISSDLHDDVGSILAGLTMQTEILSLTATEERQPKLGRISDMSRNAMSRMRDTVWAIDARKDKFESLLDRIREHATETLELKNIRFNLEIVDVSLSKKMPTQIRQNLYLICKEAITNTAKHSNGDEFQITFLKHGRNGMQLIIQDNGRIENKVLKTSGLGISNLQMRAKEIGASLEINTDNGFLIRLIKSESK